MKRRVLKERARGEFAVDLPGWVSYLPSPYRGGVAQLVRALPCHGRGYGFEPRRSRHCFRFPPS